MIDIKSMNFGEGTLEVIRYMAEAFRQLSIQEGKETQLSEWIEDNIKSVDNDFFDEWTEREKYLYSLGVISGILSEKLDI